MSKQKLNELVIFASEFAKYAFELQGEFHPVWHMVHGDGKHMVLPPPPTDDKDVAMEMIREYMRINDVVRYVFTTEAWMVRSDHEISDEEVHKMMASGGVSSNPNSFEVLQILAEDYEYGQLLAYYKITRRKRGRRELGEFILDDQPTESAGRMVGLLPRRGTLQ